LGKDRIKLSEYREFAELTFEVQLRTVLQHAWAELAHDRNYKFSTALPDNIQRRLNLYAGMLEIADSGFDSLATEIDNYAAEVGQRTGAGELDIELTSIALEIYLGKKMELLTVEHIEHGRDLSDVIEELHRFGISTLRGVDALFSPEFIEAYTSQQISDTFHGLLRDLMMFENVQRYFAVAWAKNWQAISSDTVAFLSNRYGRQKIRNIIKKYDIDCIDDDD
jgi:hypothetical protein